MIALWSSLVVVYVTLFAAFGVPVSGSLLFAITVASATVAMALLVRLIFSCSLERALAGAVVGLGGLHIVLALAAAREGNLNARVGEHVTWIDGSPTAAGLWGFMHTLAGMTVATLLAYLLLRGTCGLIRRLSATEAASDHPGERGA